MELVPLDTPTRTRTWTADSADFDRGVRRTRATAFDSDGERYIRRLVARGGPQPSDYAELDFQLQQTYEARRAGQLTAEGLAGLHAAFGESLSPETMQGLALAKLHGYAGDFEIIDRIYRVQMCPQPHLVNWDRYYHQHAAPKAVRNRKTYFHRLLDRHCARKEPLAVLKIAVGPGRSMFEWLTAHPQAAVAFECVEMDPSAIAYASRLNEPFRDRITFVQKNALRYRPAGPYDLIWAAGIFDYFDDRVFLNLLQRLLPAVAEGGEVVIGNFSDRNPSRAYMELVGNWQLHHRSAEKLAELARAAGAEDRQIRIGVEPELVNLFLHIGRTSPALLEGAVTGFGGPRKE